MDASIDTDTILASIAILVSGVTALFSYIEGRNLANRQNSFELRLYILTILDPAKGKITQFISDMNRQVNAAAVGESLGQIDPLLLPQGEGPQIRMDALARLDRQVVDTHNAISHHLSPDDQTEIETARMALEKLCSQYDALRQARRDKVIRGQG